MKEGWEILLDTVVVLSHTMMCHLPPPIPRKTDDIYDMCLEMTVKKVFRKKLLFSALRSLKV